DHIDMVLIEHIPSVFFCGNIMGTWLTLACVSLLAVIGSCSVASQSLEWDDACGISKYADAGSESRTKRMVGGTPSRKGEFPWVVSIGWGNGDHACNGFIIDKNWILSAQHCFGVGTDPSHLTIWVGNSRTKPHDGTPYVHSRIIFHPMYDYNNGQYKYDIVMMKLSVPLKWTDDVRPICAPELKKSYVNYDAWLAGWGNTHQGGAPTVNLQHAQLSIIDNKYCDRLTGNDKIFDFNICHIGAGDGKDAGDGDSGGVLMVKDKTGRFRAAGIQSWGYWPAGQRTSPCTRITYFMSYINYVRKNK
ncbi:unnamed protein product, partial [Owenia fusiformis]